MIGSMRTLGRSSLEVTPFCFGTNLFGWTIDQSESFVVLDRYLEMGGNFIDTADAYNWWVEGHSGGETETILGAWLRARRNRDKIVLATKVGRKPSRRGMAPAVIRAAMDESLERLGVETVDLLYAHIDDTSVPLVETLAALDGVVKAGKARFLGASNYTGPRLREALKIQKEEGFAPFIVQEAFYNLLRRDMFEGDLRDICIAEGMSCLPFFSLASGLLTGKYMNSPRGEDNLRKRFIDRNDGPRTSAILEVLAGIADAHGVGMGATALAWLAAQPCVAAPIASTRTPAQLDELLPMLTIELSPDEFRRLDEISAPTPWSALHRRSGWLN